MAISLYLGNGATSQTQNLNPNDPSTVPAGALNAPIQGTENPAGSAGMLFPSSVSVGTTSVTGGLSGSGGVVDITYNGGLNFAVAGAWNSVKNAVVVATEAVNLTFQDFVQVDVYDDAQHSGYGSQQGNTGTGQASSVIVHDAKRGDLYLGDNGDTVRITTTTNNADWSNKFNVDTGAGNDTISFGAGTSNGINTIINGSTTSAAINVGGGINSIDLGNTSTNGYELNLATLQIDGATTATDFVTGFDVNKDQIQLLNGTSSGAGTAVDTGQGAEITLGNTTVFFKGISASTINAAPSSMWTA